MSIKPLYREKYDICISRAVASLDTLSEYCIPFVKVGGYFISMKSSDVDEELESSLNAIKILGGKIIIEKTRGTPTKYPRGGGKPRKNPL